MLVRRKISGTIIAEYGALVIVGLGIVIDMAQGDQAWWWAAGLLLVLGAMIAFWPRRPLRPYYFFLEGALVVGLTLLHPFALFLGFSFSAEIVGAYPNLVGTTGVALIALAVGGIMMGVHDSDLFSTLMIASGYAGFGSISYSWSRAEVAQEETQALLEQLQQAHRQLQAYAEQVEELAVAEERNRLAREMHDTLGHRLTVAAVQLEGAQRLIPDDPRRAAAMVGTVRDQVREALAELRRTVATLRTPLEAGMALPAALSRLVSAFEGATDLQVHPSLPEALPDLPPAQRLALYRAAQEALTNVQRHAEAGEVWLRLSAGPETITLLVTDDGRGLPPNVEKSSFGLRGLRERASQLGGTLDLEARPGGGTQLRFRLPLPMEETDA